jgi:hypothetical protein
MIKVSVFAMLSLLLNITSADALARGKKHLNCRDAVSGEYVTPAHAKKHPDTTVCEKSK